jgi:replicative DNA helicase
MTAEQLVHRIICSQSEVESDKIRTGALAGSEYQRIVRAVHEMQNQVMLIDDQPGLKITDLRARARRMKESYNVGLIVIDYLQLISGSGSAKTLESRQNEISEISRMLKTLARELNVPIICLSQLSRKVEDRQGHRPMMSDLRESGCLAKESLICCADGNFLSMGELLENPSLFPLQVPAVDETGRIGQYPMVKVFSSGIKPLFKLKTTKGRAIRATANHPFYKEGKWTPLEQLKEGDKIAVYTPWGLDWESIASIAPDGVEEVFDATVEGAHNFVANGFVVHNSIEQDADIVMFLLRRDYYDPLDKPGMAELIVAKNRHGGIGSVHLVFRKEIAQFNNFTPGSLDDPERDREIKENFKAFTP